MAYAYCNKHNVSWNSDKRDYCIQCVEQVEQAERPGDTMSTHTPCPQCRETHTPRTFSYDGFGVNSCGMYRERLATFSPSIPDAQRKELGALWVAAPAMLEALKDCLHNAKMRRESGFECGPTIEREIERTEQAIRLAEGGQP